MEHLLIPGVTCEMLFGGAASMIADPAGIAIGVNAGRENRWARRAASTRRPEG